MCLSLKRYVFLSFIWFFYTILIPNRWHTVVMANTCSLSCISSSGECFFMPTPPLPCSKHNTEGSYGQHPPSILCFKQWRVFFHAHTSPPLLKMRHGGFLQPTPTHFAFRAVEGVFPCPHLLSLTRNTTQRVLMANTHPVSYFKQWRIFFHAHTSPSSLEM